MRIRSVLLAVPTAVLVSAAPAYAVPAVAGPATAPPVTVAASTPVARLVDCDEDGRTAAFEGDMRTMAGATRLQMRFSVEVRAARGDWQRVQAPNLDTWVSALPGRLRYVYDKRVANLQPGAGYRVVVRFRWRAADGDTLRQTTRRSHSCKVPDPRPDLVPLAVEADAPGAYRVTVANTGRATAPASRLALTLADGELPDVAVPAIRPGDRVVVALDGTACAPGSVLQVAVDATGLVDEAVEADDILGAPCPGAEASLHFLKR